MADRRVTATSKHDGDITALCGSWIGASSVDKVTAIYHIEQGIYTYYVNETGTRVDVRVVRGDSRRGKYLRTTADRFSRNNLDNLPDC